MNLKNLRKSNNNESSKQDLNLIINKHIKNSDKYFPKSRKSLLLKKDKEKIEFYENIVNNFKKDKVLNFKTNTNVDLSRVVEREFSVPTKNLTYIFETNLFNEKFFSYDNNDTVNNFDITKQQFELICSGISNEMYFAYEEYKNKELIKTSFLANIIQIAVLFLSLFLVILTQQSADKNIPNDSSNNSNISENDTDKFNKSNGYYGVSMFIGVTVITLNSLVIIRSVVNAFRNKKIITLDDLILKKVNKYIVRIKNSYPFSVNFSSISDVWYLKKNMNIEEFNSLYKEKIWDIEFNIYYKVIRFIKKYVYINKSSLLVN